MSKIMNQRIPLSTSMALSALKDEVEDLMELERQVREKRESRNRLLIDARNNGIPYTRLISITGLSRDTIAAIVHSPASPTGQKPF